MPVWKNFPQAPSCPLFRIYVSLMLHCNALCCPPCQIRWPCFVWPTILFTPDIFHFLLTWRVFPPSPLSLNSERSVPEIQASSISWTPSIIGQQSSFAPPHIYCITISLFWEYPSWIVPEVSCQTKTLWSFTLSFAGEAFLRRPEHHFFQRNPIFYVRPKELLNSKHVTRI